MENSKNDSRVIVTSGGTFCVYDDAGRFIGTVTQPVDRQPIGPGRDTVYLARPSLAAANGA